MTEEHGTDTLNMIYDKRYSVVYIIYLLISFTLYHIYTHSTHSPAAGGPKGFARRAPPGLRREWSE